jgi:hypothetical protein
VDQQADNAPEEAKFPLGAWEYHSGMKLIETSEKKPLRIFTHVAEHDLRENDPEETHHNNWVMANQRTAAALKAKGLRLPIRLQQGDQALRGQDLPADPRGHAGLDCGRATRPE